MKIYIKFFLIGLCLSVFLWVLDSFIGSFWFPEESFFDRVFVSVFSYEFYIRLLPVLTIFGFAFFSANLIQQLHSSKEKNLHQHHLLTQSEAEYRGLVESINDVVYRLDALGTIQFVNGVVETVFGYKPEELLGRNFLEFVYYEDRAEIQERFEKLKQNEHIQRDYRLIRRDGSIAWVRSSSRAFFEHNQVVAIHGVIADITRQKLIELEIVNKKDEIQSIFLAAPIGIGVVANRVFIECNNRFSELLGYTKEELIGQSTRIIYPNQEEFDRVGEIHYQEMQKHGKNVIETLFLTKDGRILEILLSSAVLNPNDASKGITFTVTDITKRKQDEQKLKLSEEKFRSFVENANNIVYAVNREGIFTYVSPNWVDILGHEVYEVIGQHFSKFAHDEDIELCQQFLNLVYKTGEKHSGLQYRVYHKNGEVKWHESNASPIKTNKGM